MTVSSYSFLSPRPRRPQVLLHGLLAPFFALPRLFFGEVATVLLLLSSLAGTNLRADPSFSSSGAGARDALAENDPVTLVSTPAVRLRITYDYRTFWYPAGAQRARFYLPIPPETPTQHILSLSSNLHGVQEFDPADPVRRWISGTVYHSNSGDREFHWRVQIVGLFRCRHPDPLSGAVSGDELAQINGTEKFPPSEFLASTPSINWQSDSFQDWLDNNDLRIKPGESNIAFARRLFRFICNHGRYDYPPRSPWNAAQTCHRLHTDCGGFSLTFTAACRASHVPARLMVGQWFKSQGVTADDFSLEGRQPHVYCEFFAPASGWIPVDLASELMGVNSPAGGSFFGQDPGIFLTWYWDTDLHVIVPDEGDEWVQWLQNPAPWFSENAGSAGGNGSHHWSVEVLP